MTSTSHTVRIARSRLVPLHEKAAAIRPAIADELVAIIEQVS